MDHSYYRDKISAYSDGALEHQERELIRRHLEECADCQNLLEKLNHFSATVEEKSGLKNDEYFENLAKRIEQRIAAPQEKVVDVRDLRWKSIWWKISAAAASLILVGTIGYYQYQDDQEMPARVLDDLRTNQNAAAVKTDSVSANEEAEIQGGRSDGKELVGKVTESEKEQVKREQSNLPVGQEKDKQPLQDKDILGNDSYHAPSASVVPKPSELKEKASDEIAASTKKADFGTVRVLAETPTIITSDAVNDSIASQQLTLSQWRSNRDSIQNILGLEQDTLANSRKSQLNKLAAPSTSGLVKIEDSVRIYQELANSWFQIAIQTQDGNEKNRAVQFLNWYKNRFPADSPAVNVQLQQVPK